MIWGLFGTQRRGDVAAVANLVSLCQERDVPLALELAEDLMMHGLIVGYSFGGDCVYEREQEVGPMLKALDREPTTHFESALRESHLE